MHYRRGGDHAYEHSRLVIDDFACHGFACGKGYIMSKKKKILPPPESVGLPCTGVESHAHMDAEAFAEDFDAVFSRAASAGVQHIGQVFLGPDAWANNKGMFDNYPNVFFLMGIHPCDADKCTEYALNHMRDAFTIDSRLRAIGEIGLDFYWDDQPHDVQREAFRVQLALAKELEKPVVIHSRDAHDETIAMLEQEEFVDYPLLWHCFGGDKRLAMRIVANGWHVSIPGPVTFPKNDALRDALKVIPPEKLLLETDCPYLTPMPYRGKRNEPAYLAFTAQRVAEQLNVAATELWTLCGNNAKRFFDIT